ncbi:alpha-L-fucosidase [Lachnoclostridium sp. An76]|uniref:alpha-L-fucosidase n=1 Tax=Lachnoclostridium sp. An76 TaxID=1965654 RepID=UPI0013A5F38A|nr:alpha-L-fucosidase [Lachnoclostridium sp. An76]
MKKKTARSLALLMAAAMTGTTFFGTGAPVAQAADEWIGDDQLKENSTSEPEADDVLPSENQYNYQKEELAAFCHFGPNTFNEIEWGENYGDKTPNEIFKLTQDFDADTLVKAIKDAGFHKLIVTAKHHDGFCIWASDYTEYDVDAATNYPGDAKTGRRDILEEISAACTEHDIDMGLYLSPWDIHDPSYGYYDENRNPVSADEDVLDYNDYYNDQLEEILGDDRYGNEGHFVEVWMDGAKGSGANAQEYDFERWFATIQKYEGKASGKYDSDCMLFGAQAYTTVRWIGNENGYADKNTWSKSIVDYENNTINSNSQGGYTLGWENGNQWTVPEADARITSGWFWGTTKAAPKSIEALGTMYFNSVGHNSPLLLNIPPNNQGTVDEAILNRVAEFGQNIKDTFDENMAAADGAEVKASDVRGSDTAFKPGNTVDGNDDTYWTTNDGTNEGSLLIDLGSSKKFDVVSIEEAIQNGQRINSYKVEYRNGSGAWTVLDEGETIGAKRLVRTSAVTADQIKITVSTTDGKVPMISEVGVYKASEGFELAASAPTGMDVIDIEDSAADDNVGFTFTGGTWNKETGTNFVNETNRWANAGASLELNFTGSKVYLVGTKDSGHGQATITIDGGAPVTVDTSASERATGQVWFSSEDLTDGPHTLTLTVDTKAIGIEAAYVINNGGVGMIGLEADEFTMNEDETMNVKITRVGGTNGRIKAYLSPNPGSAIQDDFYTEPVVVTLADGESETTVPVRTRRNTNTTGTQDFSIELNSPSTGLILGFIDAATVNILDAESMTKEQLQELVDSVSGWSKDVYSGDWASFESALAAANVLLAQETPDALEMGKAYAALENAKNNLQKRTQFTAEDPLVLPAKQGVTVRAEAELFELVNGETHDFVKAESDAYSNGMAVSWFKPDNVMYVYYNAPTTGTYTVTVQGQSGRTSSNPNRLIVSEENNNFAEVTQDFNGTNASNPAYENLGSFDINVTTAGPGVMKIATDSHEGPNIDYLDITPKDIVSTFDITASATTGGSVEVSADQVVQGGSFDITITPDSGYEISQVLVGGSDVTENVQEGKYTVSDVQSDIKVNVMFSFANYTEANRFQFPTAEEDTVTLEAEYFTLQNTGENEQWPLQVSEADWASNGKFVNSLNENDVISVPYFAEKIGTYKITATYRSGSTVNSLAWSTEPEGLIEGEGRNTVATPSENNGQGKTRTVDFTVTVTKPGAGVWIFTGPSGNSPQLDKFDIVLTEEVDKIADKTDLEIAIQDAERELAKENTYSQETRADLEAVLVNAKTVFEDPYTTQSVADQVVEKLKEKIDNLAYISYNVRTEVVGGAGGTLTPSKETVDRGESVDITITPNYGFTLTSLEVNGNEITSFHKYNVSYTISNITQDQVVKAEFEKTGYTVGEPFEFPTGTDTATLEAEDFTLFNVNGDTERYKMGITNGSAGAWDEGATYINAFEPGDYISVPYTAKAGTYEVKAIYSSGSATNKLVWDSDGTIESGQVSAGNTNANEFVTATFEVTVTEDGTGVWTFTAPEGDKSPRVDKFEITAKGSGPVEPEEYTVTASVDGGNGTITPESAEVEAGGSVDFTIMPNEGYEISDVTVNGTSVIDDVDKENGTYTLSNINEDTAVVVTFEEIREDSDQYTEKNPFVFPTEVNGTPVTLEAEKMILQNTGTGEAWPLQVSEAAWASNGKFVNAMNAGDSVVLYYTAEKAGTYEATLQYRSGDTNNSMTWTEKDGKIADGSLDSVEAEENATATHTVVLTWEVETPGAGAVTFLAGAKNAPQLDKFDVVLVKEKTDVPEVNKEALAEAIAKAEEEAAKTDVYTAESIAALEEAIADAKEVYGDESAEQEQVDAQVSALEAAIEALVKLPEPPQTYTITASAGEGGTITPSGEVTVNVGEAQTFTIKADEGWHIKEVIINGESVGAEETYTMEAAGTIEALFEKDAVEPEVPDKSALEAALKEAAEILAKTDKYTEESLKDYKAVVDEAQAVYDDPDATAEEIADAVQKLTDARDLLKEIDKEEPGTGDKPGTGTDKPGTGSGNGADKAVQTGDNTSPILWAAVLAAACAAGTAAVRTRTKKNK